MAKIGLFFGAGAEIDYGLPTGGKFALDIFRMSKEEDKKEFKDKLTALDPQSQIATKWLPENYIHKNIYVFGKSNFEDIISSSLEYRRNNIIDYLKKFDSNVSKILEEWEIDHTTLNEKFKSAYHSSIGDKLYSQEIRLNDKLTDDVKIFDSIYFSAYLKALEKSKNKDIRRIVTAILELLLGSLGQNLVTQLNEEIFTKTPPQFNVFDDIGGIFNMNYSHVGQVGMEIVIEDTINNIDDNSDIEHILFELGKKILEDIYSLTLDYQSLIDSHYRYLYNPSSHWAKFTRIAVFLHTVRRYISSLSKKQDAIENGPGFYHDLIEFEKLNNISINTIGTTNYNNLIPKILEGKVTFNASVFALNGSVNDYYNPYKNKIITDAQNINNESEIVVPFIFTQSGVKPLTSITMSKRYVDLYDGFKRCDKIAVIGYAFNRDDGHINGLFRSLIEEDEKEVHIFDYNNDMESYEKEIQYREKLRLDSTRNLKIHSINEKREVNEVMWYEKLID